MVILKVGAGAEHWAEKETAKRARRSFEIDLSEEVSKLAVHCFLPALPLSTLVFQVDE